MSWPGHNCIFIHKPKWVAGVFFVCPDCGLPHKASGATRWGNGWIWNFEVQKEYDLSKQDGVVCDPFDKLAGDLHDAVHEASALVNLEGQTIGWAPEDAIPLIAAALKQAYVAGRESAKEK